ncbi:hypothetical protein D3C81_1664840 [compost metagenome]
MDANGHLLGVCRIDKSGVLLQTDLDQPLLAFISDHIDVLTDELHRLRITETDQRHTAQNPAVEGQLDQLAVFVGDGEQAFAHRVVGQR